MRQLNLFSRRRFGALLGAKLALLAGPGMAQDSATQHHVSIKRFRFDPVELVIKPGDVVVWTNFDPAPHTATETGESWDSGQLDKGQSHSRRFDAQGVDAYFCRFHPNMTGKITVSA